MRQCVKDACVVAGVAAVTAAGVFAVARPRMAVAEGEAEARPVERPALKVDGVVLTLVTDKQKYEAGENATLTLTMVNTRDIDVSLDAVLSMLTTEAGSMMMRRMPVPKEAWRHECALTLAPGETRVVGIATDKALAAGQTAMFNIAVGKNTVTAAWLVVPGGKTLARPSAKGQAPAEPTAVPEGAEAEAQPSVAKPAAKTDAEAR